MKGASNIEEKLRAFRLQYYKSLLLKGLILSFTIVLGTYLFLVLLEYLLWMGSGMRLTLLLIFGAVSIYAFVLYLKEPLIWWSRRRGLGDEQSARIIGGRLPEVGDRLLNLVQLESADERSSLLEASIHQRESQLIPFRFESVVDLKEAYRFLRYLLIPLGILVGLFLFRSEILSTGTARILQFNKEFVPPAPFTYIINNNPLEAFYNEDFLLSVSVKGESIPEDIYLITAGRKLKLEATSEGLFAYNFDNLQMPVDFYLEGAGHSSGNYSISIVRRPELNGLFVEVIPPSYTHQNRRVVNSGNLEVPEGSQLTWRLTTASANQASIRFDSGQWQPLESPEAQSFTFSKRVLNDGDYELLLRSAAAENKEKIFYSIDVIEDQHPKIVLNALGDSVLFKNILVGGFISDDFGLSDLELIYSIQDEDNSLVSEQKVELPIQRGQTQQSFMYNWNLESLNLKSGNYLEYYLMVWDNDAVNGRKSTRTPQYRFRLPTEDQLVLDIEEGRQQTTQNLEKSSGQASSLQQKIEDAAQKLKGKQTLDWQDKKMLEEITKEENELEKLIDQLKKENQLNNEKSEAFLEQNEKIRQKSEQIQKLMEDLLDEETKKLFEELRKLLEQNADPSQMKDLLDKLNRNTQNLEKELDRILQIAKQWKFEMSFEQVQQMLDKQIEKQQELLRQTEQLENERSSTEQEQQSKELSEEQSQLKSESEAIKDKLNELDEMSRELENKMEIPEDEQIEDAIDGQEQSKEMLEQNNPSKSKSGQQKAIQKMKEMSNQMANSSAQAGMEIDMENLESLKQVVHGLLKLSFDQERLLHSFRDLHQGDPRFNALAEEQLQIKDNAKVLEDSLLSLANKDPFLGSFVINEISDLNEHLDRTNEANRERRRPQAQTEMQASMTSLNNLALMLDSHYDMMMQMMANAKPSMKSKGKKEGKSPSLSQLQMELNQRIQQLKESGKSGRELSEDLARMAAEQESIRRAIEELQENMKNEGKMPGGDLPSQMEQTELDLVNKQLTDQLIKRQQEILTRLLESENSMREQDQDEERKGETAKERDGTLPKEFEEYLRLREKEVELLKTVPPKLLPYYRREVDGYFQRLGNQ